MSLDVVVDGSITRNVASTEATDGVRITGLVFNFEAVALMAELRFLKGGDEYAQELWIFTGPTMVGFMQSAPVGVTRVEVLEDIMQTIVLQVQGNLVLKQALIDNGELVITNKSLLSYQG
jgi:hypothetical protein